MKEYRSMVVTPKMAQEFLKMNVRNRKPNPARIDRYARDMISGAWNENNDDPIEINKFNKLENGQHRLMAVIKANKPIRFLVVTGGEPAGETYDRGRPRTVSDSLKIGGRIGTTSITQQVALVRLLARFGYGITILSDAEIEHYLMDNGNDVLEAIKLTTHGKNKAVTSRKEIHLATYCALRNGVESHQLESFFTAMNTGFMDDRRQSSAIVLRNTILDGNRKTIPTGRKGFSKELFLITELAIRDYLSMTPRTKKYTVSDRTKSIFLPIVAKADGIYFNREIAE